MKMLKKKDFATFIDIVVNAYPGFKITTDEKKRKFIQRCIREQAESSTEHYFGLWRNKKLLGGMLLHDFVMTYGQERIPVGGVGLVAVDLLHKKEKVCKELIAYFLEHYASTNTWITALHPFRPDFYKKMGFGYGTKASAYRIKPAHLPRGPSRDHIVYLTTKDMRALLVCHNRYAEKTHGMFRRSHAYLQRVMERENVRVVGYKTGTRIQGYCVFSFKQSNETNFIANDLHVHELVFDNADVFGELSTFLHTQADQAGTVVYATQDEYFHFVPFDPRNGTDTMIAPLYHATDVQGVGIMYRIINTRGLFEQLHAHNFNNENCVLRITVRDTFFKKNNGSTIVQFDDGRAYVKRRSHYAVEIKLDVSDFSSLLMGAVDFSTLHRYGLARISDAGYTTAVNRIFAVPRKPLCMTMF